MYIIFLFLTPDLYKEAQSAYSKGDFDLARKKVEQFLIKYPKDKVTPEALYLAAKLRRKSDEALNYYEKIVKEYPNSKVSADALYNIAQYFYVQRDYLSAIEIYTRIVSDYSTSKAAKDSQEWIDKIHSFYFIQLGSFSQPENARKLAEKIKSFDPMIIIKKDGYYRVWIGTFSSLKEAGEFLNRNNLDGFITKIK